MTFDNWYCCLNWNSYRKYTEQFNQAKVKRIELVFLRKLGPEFTEKPHSKAIYVGH